MNEPDAIRLKPAPVPPNARIGVIAPASAAQPDRVKTGLDALHALGYSPVLATHALERGPLYFAGTRNDRLADLHAAFADPATSAILCLRGGYGSNYLLGGLNLDLIRSHPKPLLGYSDLTDLQLYLLDTLGLPAFHGPMLAADFHLADGVHLGSFCAALTGKPYSVGTAEGMRTLKPGNACGVLYGGCLTIMVSMLATKWEPQTENKLLFLEDIAAKPYQVDRMLWQLREADKFEGVRGIIFGEMLDCVSPGASADLLEQTIMTALDGLDVPIAFGLRSGHVSRQNVTLTFGVHAELDAGAEATLRILEPAVKV
jgi:muramoyltetrapeptide carboxypeptidase